MGRETGISWTDATFNPWWGCTKVSAGCDNCYAEKFDRRVGGSHWGKGMPRREFGDKHWNEPLKWDVDAKKSGRHLRVFCASMADVMDDEAPSGARQRLWELIDATPNIIWQLLTKRPHRYVRLPAFKHRQRVAGYKCGKPRDVRPALADIGRLRREAREYIMGQLRASAWKTAIV